MGSVISQSLNIKTKIVCDLSASGEQDSVSSASVSPLWPEVTNYSVISHLSCLSFHNRMSKCLYTLHSITLCTSFSESLMLERILLTDSLGRHSSMRESLTSSAARGNSCTTSRLVSCIQRRLPGLLNPNYSRTHFLRQ